MDEGEFLVVGITSPSPVAGDSGIGLVVFVALSEFEVAAVFETKVFSAGGDNRVARLSLFAAQIA